MSDIILFAHPTFGVLGIIAAVWVFVETLNAGPGNLSRLRTMAVLVTVWRQGRLRPHRCRRSRMMATDAQQLDPATAAFGLAAAVAVLFKRDHLRGRRASL